MEGLLAINQHGRDEVMLFLKDQAQVLGRNPHTYVMDLVKLTNYWT